VENYRRTSRAIRSSCRSLFGLVLALTIITYGRTVWAKPKAIALYVEGADAGAVRDELATALPEGSILVNPTAFSDALVEQGQTAPFGKKLDGATHAAAVKRLRSAAIASGAAVVLVGRSTKGKGGARVHLLLVEASGDEEALADLVLDLKADAHDDTQVLSTVGSALDKYKAAPAAEKVDASVSAPFPAVTTEGGPTESVDSASPRPTGRVARSLFEFELGGEAAGRNFVYNDGLTADLRSYNVLPAAMFTVNAQVFPFSGLALTGVSRVLRDIGVIGALSQSLFLESAVSGGSNVSTSETSYLGGLRVRIHPWGDEGTVIGISDAYASQAFTFGETSGTLAAQIPSVDYTANRTAVDVRIPAGRFALLAEAGFRAVLDAGAVAQRFRFTSVEGVDAELGGALSIAQGWEGRLVADYERYFYAFSPIPANAYVAGGALDQFFGARLALAWIY
jgi:hypothetical protein